MEHDIRFRSTSNVISTHTTFVCIQVNLSISSKFYVKCREIFLLVSLQEQSLTFNDSVNAVSTKTHLFTSANFAQKFQSGTPGQKHFSSDFSKIAMCIYVEIFYLQKSFVPSTVSGLNHIDNLNMNMNMDSEEYSFQRILVKPL